MIPMFIVLLCGAQGCVRMPYVDRHSKVCGFLDVEEKETNAFVRRYFHFDPRTGLLQYFMDNPQVSEILHGQPTG